jgi:hypothetical protein
MIPPDILVLTSNVLLLKCSLSGPIIRNFVSHWLAPGSLHQHFQKPDHVILPLSAAYTLWQGSVLHAVEFNENPNPEIQQKLILEIDPGGFETLFSGLKSRNYGLMESSF